ncbi:hypothetical protein [Streptosporangium sandarakinum]|uniref:hypothetical protein n=1 Tax=Streptosporangium sandarakinum TaxID=1260955 RepID=UPI00371D3F65
MTTKTDTKKAINQQLRHLRADWRRWRDAKTDDPGRIVETRLPIPIDAAGKTDVAARITFI